MEGHAEIVGYSPMPVGGHMGVGWGLQRFSSEPSSRTEKRERKSYERDGEMRHE